MQVDQNELLVTWFAHMLSTALGAGITEEQILSALTTKNIKAGLEILRKRCEVENGSI